MFRRYVANLGKISNYKVNMYYARDGGEVTFLHQLFGGIDHVQHGTLELA